MFYEEHFPPRSRTSPRDSYGLVVGDCRLLRANILGPVGTASTELLSTVALGERHPWGSVTMKMRTGDSAWHTATLSVVTVKFNTWTDCFPPLPIRMHNFHILRRISTNASRLCSVKRETDEHCHPGQGCWDALGTPGPGDVRPQRL